jgi:SpoVK/Ycf46/Vps4 family AAA+-type ATPase
MANMNGRNGKKTGAQLQRDIDESLAARQKREAKRGASASLLPQYQTNDPRTGLQRYSDEEYERRELREANEKLREVEKAPLADRKEGAARFFEAMRDRPEIVGERVGWLLDGNYGYGSKMLAKRVLSSPRMNRAAALTHMVAAFEWSTPGAMARAGWKKLTASQQAALDRAVLKAIRDAEAES